MRTGDDGFEDHAPFRKDAAQAHSSASANGESAFTLYDPLGAISNFRSNLSYVCFYLDAERISPVLPAGIASRNTATFGPSEPPTFHRFIIFRRMLHKP
jgi:hypothetical protein